MRYAMVAALLLVLASSVGGVALASEDPDGDGLTTEAEREQYGTDPTNADTDGDGLDDGREVELGTDPTDVDTDGDGYTDGEEVRQGTDPGNPNDWPGHETRAQSGVEKTETATPADTTVAVGNATAVAGVGILGGGTVVVLGVWFGRGATGGT